MPIAAAAAAVGSHSSYCCVQQTLWQLNTAGTAAGAAAVGIPRDQSLQIVHDDLLLSLFVPRS